MKATGIVRRIDDLGRVVIPKEIRRTMRIREGDPLEIYTDREGEVIFKKYSPIGELAAFSTQYVETLYKTCALTVVISDRDAVISSAGVPKKDFVDKKISDQLEKIIEGRNLYTRKEGAEKLPVIVDNSTYYMSCAMPIITEGDIIGSVVSLHPWEEEANKDKNKATVDRELESKLILTAASFLGKQLES